jgi:hypothetical protein
MFGITGKSHPSFGKKHLNSSSKYFGIDKTINKGNIYWRIRINIGNNLIFIGKNKNEIEAAKMYNKYVVENKLANSLNDIHEERNGL